MYDGKFFIFFNEEKSKYYWSKMLPSKITDKESIATIAMHDNGILVIEKLRISIEALQLSKMILEIEISKRRK